MVKVQPLWIVLTRAGFPCYDDDTVHVVVWKDRDEAEHHADRIGGYVVQVMFHAPVAQSGKSV